MDLAGLLKSFLQFVAPVTQNWQLKRLKAQAKISIAIIRQSNSIETWNQLSNLSEILRCNSLCEA
jgi:hypothetical protein